MIEGRATPAYDKQTSKPSQYGERESFVNRSNASFSAINMVRVKDESELY